MSGAAITLLVTVVTALVGGGVLIWRSGRAAGQETADTAVIRVAIDHIREAIAKLATIDLDHEQRIRDLERGAWGTPRRDVRERRHGGSG